MDVSVIIVSWNTKEFLRRLLLSIYKHTAGLTFEILVVDNASHDGSVEMVRSEFPEVQLLPYPANLGFSRANNKAAEVATGKFLCFLNADTELKENSLKIIFEEISSNRRIGILGCHLEFANGRHQDSVRKFPTLGDQFFILLKLPYLFPRAAVLRRYLCANFDYGHNSEVEQIMGAVMMISRDNFRRLGGFDERFYLWFEEVDLQKRLRDKFSLKTCYTAKTSIIHHKSQSFAQTRSVTKQRLYNQSLRYYFLKQRGYFSHILCFFFGPLSMFLAWVIDFFKLNKLITKDAKRF